MRTVFFALLCSTCATSRSSLKPQVVQNAVAKKQPVVAPAPVVSTAGEVKILGCPKGYDWAWMRNFGNRTLCISQGQEIGGLCMVVAKEPWETAFLNCPEQRSAELTHPYRVRGGLIDGQVSGVIMKRWMQVQFCWQQAINYNEGLTRGFDRSLDIKVSQQGDVTAIRLHSFDEDVSLDDQFLVNCLMTVVSRWKFPPAAQPSHMVNFELRFRE